MPILEDYMRWRREDGQLFDPWMRVHERLGARVVAALPRSMKITGTVREWETGVSPDFGQDPMTRAATDVLAAARCRCSSATAALSSPERISRSSRR